MRATVLLCLLHVAFGTTEDFRYTWDTSNEIPEVTNVCLVDQASCGCCLMQRQLQRMETFFNYTNELLKYKMSYTETTLSKINRKSAFSASLNNNGSLGCYGPFTQDKLIFYGHVFINVGGSYDPATGEFTVAISGVYSLSVTVYAIRTGTKLSTCAQLLVNGKVVSELLEQNNEDFEDSASILVALKLAMGDVVSVNMPARCFICDGKGHYNTVTGFLLYATN